VDAAAQRYHQIKAVKMSRAKEPKPEPKPDKPGPEKDEAN
jgi:hypothetical protein